ncbi:putative phosphohydrolase [Thioflavicoccus mobilis 8321]|uniref:Putative phosphohydrolase n=1 Tax=Thioflavicoccus mobilis 8321 TaxID=765912 RepID=L0GT77_9GAMM|nr:metallophosphoesterase [Thioflavicoccus mobilis]AGA89216.1 putative phosphohydrolase [Thioflavicoccus mobilis 8321]
MMRIVHISDLHFGRERPALVAALVPQIEALAPDLVVVSGDLTQRARRRELEAAAAFLARLPSPLLVVPGNHDIPGIDPRRFLKPWQGWHGHFADGLEPSIETADVIAVGANTVRRAGPYLDWSRGRFAPRQIERLVARLTRNEGDDGRLRILAAHHPLLLTPAGAHRGFVGRRELALRRFAAAGLDLALGGHVHLGYVGVVQGIVVSHAGTAVSTRLLSQPNGFNLIVGDRHALGIEHWGWADDAFVTVTRTEFRRGIDGWRPAP